jgi:hypothetical protein
MNRAALLLLSALACTMAIGQSADEQRRAAYRAKMERIFAIDRRITQTQPMRREYPARAENIRDEEVGEIQGVALQAMPGAIVNIATVVTGCPCEEGASCTDQVWIVAYQPQKTLGILLSKIASHWQVGAVQHWWFEYENLQLQRGSFRSLSDFYAARDELTEKFPTCKEKSAPNESQHP